MAIEIVDNGDFVEVLGAGFLSPDEVYKAVSDYFLGSPRTNVLWNFLNADLSGFSADRFKDVASDSARFAQKRGGSARSAIVVKSKMEYFLMQAYVARAGAESPVIFKVFTERESSIQWLQEE
ncbi:hypothetical protein [Nisaea sp.]|uniref:hypothetical protein n=1 Tax=Nisaea sp. TaxID=2024842 RepID=UPI0032EC7073